MSEPSLDRATSAVGELSASVRTLTSEVLASESLRTEKVRWMQRLLFVLVPAVGLLIVMALSNFTLLARLNAAAADAKSTNELLVGCFQPGSKCADRGAQQNLYMLNQTRQTQFVIAVCQRQNTVAEDPTGDHMIACVQRYYPGFILPSETPTPSKTPGG